MGTPAQARALDRAEPVYLVEVSLLNGGPLLRLSDRNITVGGARHEDYMDGLSGVGAELRRSDSGGLNSQVELRFKNDPWRSYPYLIEADSSWPFLGAGVVIREAYMEATGDVSDAETLFIGVLEEPREIGLTGFTCSVSAREFATDNQT